MAESIEESVLYGLLSLSLSLVCSIRRNVLFLQHTFALAAQNYFVAYFRAACTNAAYSPLAMHELRFYFL